MTCPRCGATAEHLLGHEVQGVYDGVLLWSCMSCGRAWLRGWTDRPGLQQIASEYVQQLKDAVDAEEVSRC